MPDWGVQLQSSRGYLCSIFFFFLIIRSMSKHFHATFVSVVFIIHMKWFAMCDLFLTQSYRQKRKERKGKHCIRGSIDTSHFAHFSPHLSPGKTGWPVVSIRVSKRILHPVLIPGGERMERAFPHPQKLSSDLSHPGHSVSFPRFGAQSHRTVSTRFRHLSSWAPDRRLR